MQTTQHHQPAVALKPHLAKDAQRNHESRRKNHHAQPSTLTREELRQIVIDMIG